jgi:predicted short-subunit dehydrogenase-like oxidoreductase (DUF2520 family)
VVFSSNSLGSTPDGLRRNGQILEDVSLGLPRFIWKAFIIFTMNVMKMNRDTIAILGLGKVGTAIGFLLRSAGYTIAAVASRSLSSLSKGIAYTGGEPYTNFSEAASHAECIFITTSDDAIASVCENIALGGSIKPGKKVIHMSGGGGLILLDAARRYGAHTSSIHPLQSFADVEGAIKNIPGSTFGITSDDEIKQWSIQVVKDLSGIPFFISDTDKPLYHAAACIASNYLTTLIHMVEVIYQSLGLNHEDAMHAFWPLLKGTMRNIEEKGTVHALTGPIARGDMGTLKKHIEALQNKLPVFLRAYSILGILTTELGLEKKTISAQDAEHLRKLLEGGLHDEHTDEHE